MSEALTAPQSLASLELELGGRGAIIQALVTAPPSKDLRYLLGLLADPANAARPLASLCQDGKILPGQLMEMIERGIKLRTRTIAAALIGHGTPAVVTDVMLRGAPHIDDCTRCQGVGQITPEPTTEEPNPSPAACDLCRGGGKLRYDADSECRRLALEMAGLTAKGGGINIVNSNQVAVAGGGSGYEGMQEAMDRILYGRAVEGEILPPDEPQSTEE